MRIRLLAAALALAACNGGSGDSDRDHDAGASTDGGMSTDGGADGASGPAWQPLISRTWTVEPLRESWLCTTVKTTEDVWISAVRPDTSPVTAGDMLQGPVRMELSTADEWPRNSNWPETGEYECDNSAFGEHMKFASGVGTGDLVLPEGAAIHIPAGKYLTLLTHVVNLSDVPLEGASGVLVQTTAPVDADHEADMFFAGTQTGNNYPIENDGQPHVFAGGCVFPVDWTVFSIWPHMNRIGTHMAFLHKRFQLPDQALVDDDYDFYDEKMYDQGEHLIGVNEEAAVYCTYVNNTTEDKYLSDGITQEQCLAAVYKYPAGGTPYFCAPL